MHVLIVYPGVIPVFWYGGTGRDIWYEGREMVKMGHRVTYLVGAGSTCDFAAVRRIDQGKPYNDQVPDEVDVVHFHFRPGEEIRKPYMVTIHGNSRDAEVFDFNTVFVSRDHARRHGSEMFVYNGMDWDDYGRVCLESRRDYFHFLGKAGWRVKNLRGAIRVVSRAGEKMVVLGGSRLNLRMGFHFTARTNISFKGFVGGEEKFNIMNSSKGLIFPVLWEEPMGLAIIESLYFGCPVFGTPYGSLPEIVQTDVGFLSNSAAALTEAIREAGQYSRKRCHEYAIEQFSARRMTAEYIRLFEKVLNGGTLNPYRPEVKIKPENKLLPWYE